MEGVFKTQRQSLYSNILNYHIHHREDDLPQLFIAGEKQGANIIFSQTCLLHRSVGSCHRIECVSGISQCNLSLETSATSQWPLRLSRNPNIWDEVWL